MGRTLCAAELRSSVASLQKQGRLEEVERLYRESIEGCCRNLGDWHPETLICVRGLADFLEAQGRYREAEPLYRELLEVCGCQLGDMHPDVLEVIQKLAEVAACRGQNEEAEHLFREALEGRRLQLGALHPTTQETLEKIVKHFQSQGKFREASLVQQEFEAKPNSLQGGGAATSSGSGRSSVPAPPQASRRELPQPPPQAATVTPQRGGGGGAQSASPERSRGTAVATQMAEQLDSLEARSFHEETNGRVEAAEMLAREALARARKQFGDSHPRVLTNCCRMSELLELKGCFEEAESLCREALQGFRSHPGSGVPDALHCLNRLAVLLGKQGRLQEAERVHRDAVAGRKVHLGTRHVDTLLSVSNLASCLRARGFLSEAEACCREALDGRRQVLGARHPDTLMSVSALAAVIENQGRHFEAEQLYRDALEGRLAALGDKDRDTQGSFQSLLACLRKQGRLDEAERLRSGGLQLYRGEGAHPNGRAQFHSESPPRRMLGSSQQGDFHAATALPSAARTSVSRGKAARLPTPPSQCSPAAIAGTEAAAVNGSSQTPLVAPESSAPPEGGHAAHFGAGEEAPPRSILREVCEVLHGGHRHRRGSVLPGAKLGFSGPCGEDVVLSVNTLGAANAVSDNMDNLQQELLNRRPECSPERFVSEKPIWQVGGGFPQPPPPLQQQPQPQQEQPQQWLLPPPQLQQQRHSRLAAGSPGWGPPLQTQFKEEVLWHAQGDPRFGIDAMRSPLTRPGSSFQDAIASHEKETDPLRYGASQGWGDSRGRDVVDGSLSRLPQFGDQVFRGPARRALSDERMTHAGVPMEAALPVHEARASSTVDQKRGYSIFPHPTRSLPLTPRQAAGMSLSASQPLPTMGTVVASEDLSAGSPTKLFGRLPNSCPTRWTLH